MSQEQFETFMFAQLEAMASSGLTEEEWVEKMAADFRAEWEAENLQGA